jgi:hypothetical protein
MSDQQPTKPPAPAPKPITRPRVLNFHILVIFRNGTRQRTKVRTVIDRSDNVRTVLGQAQKDFRTQMEGHRFVDHPAKHPSVTTIGDLTLDMAEVVSIRIW